MCWKKIHFFGASPSLNFKQNLALNLFLPFGKFFGGTFFEVECYLVDLKICTRSMKQHLFTI